MKLIVLILNKTEALELLLQNLAEAGITGATIVDSTGMARAIGDYESMMFMSLRKILNPDRKNNKTILTVVEDGQVDSVIDLMKKSIGDLSRPDTGIIFTVPLDRVEGIALS